MAAITKAETISNVERNYSFQCNCGEQKQSTSDSQRSLDANLEGFGYVGMPADQNRAIQAAKAQPWRVEKKENKEDAGFLTD